MLVRAAQLVADLHQRASLDAEELLRELVEGATEAVPGAQYAGITVTKRRLPSETAAATHRYPVVLEEIQSRCQQGPCLSAATQQHSIRIDDLEADDRWPLYRDEAVAQTPIRSILSFGVFRDGQTTAALNFYAEPIRAFGARSVDLGMDRFATRPAVPPGPCLPRRHRPGKRHGDGTIRHRRSRSVPVAQTRVPRFQHADCPTCPARCRRGLFAAMKIPGLASLC